MMTEIFIVVGEVGEYSDWEYWIVCAYLDEDKAKAHAKLAGDWYAESAKDAYSDGVENKEFKNPHDPKMRISWSRLPEWHCKKIECIDKEKEH